MKRSVYNLIPALTFSVSLLASGAWAQTTAPATPVTVPAATKTAAAAPVTADTTKKTGLPSPGDYRISREDTVVITCLNDPTYSLATIVLPDGTISYPKLGQITVVGMSPSQLQTKITKFLRREFIRPDVTVAIQNRQVRQVSVMGTGVKETGKRVMRDGWRVLDALADAGGLLSDRTELFTARLVRLDTNETIPLDLDAVLKNDPQANILLAPSDVLIIDAVEESKSQVQISGEVNKPGFILIPRDGSIGKALESAGGPKPTAQLSQVVIERNGTKIPLDLRQMVVNGTEPEGIKLQAGDKLVVPENKRLYYVLGAVARQGAMVLPDDRPVTLARALSDASVSIQSAETKKTTLSRQKADGTQETMVIDVEQMLATSDYSKDVPLQPGDMIYVPPKKGHKMQWNELLGTVGWIPNLRYFFNGQFFGGR